MALPATQIRRGMVLVFENDPCRVIEFRHHTPGNLRAMVQAKLKNLRTGNSFEHRFRATDHGELQQIRAALDTHHWNREATARSLGMSRTTLWRKMRELRLV